MKILKQNMRLIFHSIKKGVLEQIKFNGLENKGANRKNNNKNDDLDLY